MPDPRQSRGPLPGVEAPEPLPPLTTETPSDAVLALLDAAPRNLTPLELERELEHGLGWPRAEARRRIRGQVRLGRLAYASLHGRSVLMRSLAAARRVAPGVILAAAEAARPLSDTEVVVRIAAGAAFGAGDHPSTRLALRAIAHLLQSLPVAPRAMLDIGTGSGVLAVAALLLGVRWAVGLDFDPCALAEARSNARLNAVNRRFAVSSRPLEDLAGRYGLVSANLRFPTLMRLAPAIGRLTSAEARVVLSGLRPDEAGLLLEPYRGQGFVWRWQAQERGWCVMGLERRPAAPGLD